MQKVRALTILVAVGSLIAVGHAMGVSSLTTPAMAATIEIRNDVILESDRVYLGDFFDGLPEGKAGIEIARSPSPGREITIDRHWLVRIARAHGVSAPNAEDLPQITARRASATITSEAVTDLIAEAIVDERPEYANYSLSIDLERGLDSLSLPSGSDPTIHIDELSLDQNSGRFMVRAYAHTESGSQRVNLNGQFQAVTEVPVVTRRVGSRDIIAADDVEWIDVDATNLGQDVIIDPEELIGMAPRRGLRPNTPIRAHDVSAPEVVARGDRVTMTVVNNGLTVSARGRATQAGAIGDIIRVTNVDSNQTVEAHVVDEGHVRVHAGAGSY